MPTPMPIALHWPDIVLRLVVTVLASLLLGYDRSQHGKAAGMSTTLGLFALWGVKRMELLFRSEREVIELRRPTAPQIPPFVAELPRARGVVTLAWRPCS